MSLHVIVAHWLVHGRRCALLLSSISPIWYLKNLCLHASVAPALRLPLESSLLALSALPLLACEPPAQPLHDESLWRAIETPAIVFNGALTDHVIGFVSQSNFAALPLTTAVRYSRQNPESSIKWKHWRKLTVRINVLCYFWLTVSTNKLLLSMKSNI